MQLVRLPARPLIPVPKFNVAPFFAHLILDNRRDVAVFEHVFIDNLTGYVFRSEIVEE